MVVLVGRRQQPSRSVSDRIMPRLLLVAMVLSIFNPPHDKGGFQSLLPHVGLANALGPAFPFSQEPWASRFTNTSTTLVHFSVVPPDGTSPSSVTSVYVAMGNGLCTQLPASSPVADSEGCNPNFLRSGGGGGSDDLASLGGSSTVRVGDGSMLLSVGTATITGGTDTFLFDNVFADPSASDAVLVPNVAPVQTDRIGGSLLRVRGLVASDPTLVRYFLIGGTSDVVEEFVMSQNTHNATTTYRWEVPPGGASVTTLIGGGAVVMYPAGVLPFAVQTGFNASSTPTLSQPFFVVTMGRASGPTAATAFPAAVATVFAVAARESYVFLVTVDYMQMIVVQFGGADGTTVLCTGFTGSKINEAFCPFNAGVTPFSFGGSFVSADNGKLYVGCYPTTLYSTALLTAKVESVSIVSPNPPRTSGGNRVHPVVSVVYKHYNDTALLMFSHYDDCAVFIPDGPFPLEGGSALKTKTVELPHATEGTHVFACTTLGFCPETATCTDWTMDIPSCVAGNGCIYTAGPDSNVTCCPRSHFTPSVGGGVAPHGSHWMLAHASPARLLTVTQAVSVSNSSSLDSVTMSATPSGKTPSRSASKTPNVTATMTTTSNLTASLDTLTATTTATVSTTPSVTRNTSTRSKRTASASRTQTVSQTASASLTNTSSRGSKTRSASRTHSHGTASRTNTLSAGTPTATRTRPNSTTPAMSPTKTLSGPTPHRTASANISSTVARPSRSAYITTSHTPSLSVGVASSTPPNHKIVVIIAVSSAAAVVMLLVVALLLLLRRRRLSGASRRDALRSSMLIQADSNPVTPRGPTDVRAEDERLLSREYDSSTPVYSTLLNSNKYTISKLLGKGGYGMVFLATRTSDQRKGALKYITCRTDYDRTLALKEFEVIMKVRHPNIIPIWDFFLNWQEHVDCSAFGNGGKGGKGGRGGAAASSPAAGPPIPGFLGDQAPFQNGDDATTALTRPRYVAIVTQYYPEGDLKRYCYVEKKQGRQLSEERIVSLMTQIATLVVKLHDEAQQIVHRDLKPENILLDCNYHKAVVTDFGLAFNNVNEASHMTTQAGSLPFVAPECWSKYYNAKVDVWSMGCLLYAIATQRVTGDDSRVMFNDVDEVWFEEELRREVVSQGQYSPQLFAILMKLLVKNPAVRPTSYQVECMLGELMEARGYDTMHVVRTPLPRPQHALEREEREERLRREAEERAAEEAAARKLAREQRKQQRHQKEQQQRQ